MSVREVSVFESAEHLTEEIAALQAACAEHDDAEPFNEATMLAPSARHGLAAHTADGSLAGLLLARRDDEGVLEAELAVHPTLRRNGHGRQLVERFLEDASHAGATARIWAHGDSPASRALATQLEMTEERLLLKLAAHIDPERSPRPTETPQLRHFTMDRLDEVLTVNRRAFAGHPEQGALDEAAFLARTRTNWWRPEHLILACSDEGHVIGFHWLKVTPEEAEVYVLAVDPAAAGRGTGRALMHAGLAQLAEEGHRRVVLYVDGNNTAAVKLYRSLGFADAHRDVRWERTASHD